MAARLNREINEKHRESIRTTQLLKRLQMYALNEKDPQNDKPVELSATQVRAVEILLDRVLPKMQSIEGGMDLHHHTHEKAIEQLE